MDDYKDKRKQFAIKSYFLTLMFLLVTLLQWFVFHYNTKTHNFFISYYWVSIIFFVISLLLVIIFIFFEDLRFESPYNWIIALIIFESIVIGLATLVVRHHLYHLLLSFAIWTIVLAGFLLCGSCLQHDITLDIVVLFVLGVISIIGAMYFLMLYMVANIPYSFFVHRGFMVFSIWMFAMYHAQIINGGRFAEMRVNDYLLASLILFYDFLLMFIFTFQLAPKWSDSCDKTFNQTSWIVLDKGPKEAGYYTTNSEYD